MYDWYFIYNVIIISTTIIILIPYLRPEVSYRLLRETEDG